MVAAKLTLVISDDLIGNSIPLRKQASAHALRPILVYYILEIVISGIMGLDLP